MLLRTPDAVFYPLLSLLALVLIAVPILQHYRTRVGDIETMRAEGIVADFARLSSMGVGPGLTHEVYPGNDGRRLVSVTASHQLGDPNIIPSAGAFIALSPQELDAVRGSSVRVRFGLEPLVQNPDFQVYTGLFQAGVGQSAWIEASPDGAQGEVVRDIETISCNTEYVYVGVWPHDTGVEGAVLIDEIRVEIVEPGACEE